MVIPVANQFIIHGLSEEGKAYRAALVAIQKLHKPCKTFSGKEVCDVCNEESGKPITYPCKTRKLADEGLADRMARTNQGENK